MPTFLEALHALAAETGEFAPFVTTGLGTTTTLVCSALANSNLEATSLSTFAVLIEDGNNAGEMRWVTPTGLSRATGTITVSGAFTNAVASGVHVSLYGRMAPLTQLTGPSYQKALNLTLKRAWAEDDISLTGVSNQKHYTIDQAVYPWFTSEDRIIAIYHTRQQADDRLRALARWQWEWVSDGSSRQIYVGGAPWKTGEVGTVKVYRPANSILKRSGVWTDQTSQDAGYVALADESLLDLNDQAIIGAYYVYKLLHVMHHPGQDTSEWATMARMAAASANGLRSMNPRVNHLTGVPNLRPVGSTRRR